MTDALTCEKCGADLRVCAWCNGKGRVNWDKYKDILCEHCTGRGTRDHHPLDCAALAAANARIVELAPKLADPPRELSCMICGQDYPVWFAPNDLWNSVVRRPDGFDEWDFLCPTCFGMIAVERGNVTVFVFADGGFVQRERDELGAEIADLTEQLVDAREQMAVAQQRAWEARADAHDLRAQLAAARADADRLRQQAVGG